VVVKSRKEHLLTEVSDTKEVVEQVIWHLNRTFSN